MGSNVNAVACKLEKARREQDLTYQEIADYIGKSKAYVWKLLTGKMTIHPETAEKIAEFFELDAGELLEPDPKINIRMPERFLSYMDAPRRGFVPGYGYDHHQCGGSVDQAGCGQR